MLPDFFGGRLKPLAVDLPSSWRLWQYKSLNLHRGVIHWDATARPCTLSKIRDEVRAVVRDHFRPSWWRGFGFGAIVSLGDVDDSFNHAADVVDVRNNSQGTWQWLVLHFPGTQTAVGVCTWTEGYLAPVYHDLLAELRKTGFTCESFQKDMDALMRRLLVVRDKLRAVKRALGGLEGLSE
jgi:hypothetical protein